MKRRKGGILISLSALLLIGLSLFFWANYPKFSGQSSRQEIKTWEQLMEEEAFKKAEAEKTEASENFVGSQEKKDTVSEQTSQSDEVELVLMWKKIIKMQGLAA